MGVFSETYAGCGIGRDVSFFSLIELCFQKLAQKAEVQTIALRQIDADDHRQQASDMLVCLDAVPIVAVHVAYQEAMVDYSGFGWVDVPGYLGAAAADGVARAKGAVGGMLEELGQLLQDQVVEEKGHKQVKARDPVQSEAKWTVTLRAPGQKVSQWSGTVFEQNGLDEALTAYARMIIDARKAAAAANKV